jgi:propanol-preferring alcohol dehydrogenase
MRAVQLTRTGHPLEMRDVPDAPFGPGEIVVDVRAAGICHSDAHYRAGRGRVKLPLTPGHEIAGVVSEIGEEVTNLMVGDRVALHYLVTCGTCLPCTRHGEQFCAYGAMLGKDRDGGYAEQVIVPARNAVAIPEPVPFEEAAIMMCSTATAFHALRLAALRPGESLAILGFGGLGFSALQLGGVLGARSVAVVDVVPAKLEIAESHGAAALDARRGGLTEEIERTTGGADVVLDFAGNASTRLAALRALSPAGRLVLVALGGETFSFDPYADVLTAERRIIGCSDHLITELTELMTMARSGAIDLGDAITRRVPFDDDAINDVLDDLDRGTAHRRSVITM